MKEQLVDRYNWDDNSHIYVREFIPRKTLNYTGHCIFVVFVYITFNLKVSTFNVNGV